LAAIAPGRLQTGRRDPTKARLRDRQHLQGGGCCVGLVREIKPAGQIVHELIEEARRIIAQRLLGLVQPA
jgi:hypothetical protein